MKLICDVQAYHMSCCHDQLVLLAVSGGSFISLGSASAVGSWTHHRKTHPPSALRRWCARSLFVSLCFIIPRMSQLPPLVKCFHLWGSDRELPRKYEIPADLGTKHDLFYWTEAVSGYGYYRFLAFIHNYQPLVLTIAINHYYEPWLTAIINHCVESTTMLIQPLLWSIVNLYVESTDS